MGVLGTAHEPYTPFQTTSKIVTFCVLAVYAGVAATTAARHENWADEAQSWLLARDAGLFDLWTRLLHYEGTTGLWQTLLHALIRLGLPYQGLSFVSAAMGIIATWLLLHFSPLPLPLRIAIPFSYFCCYQYAVIARSYCLLPPLLFLAAALFHNAGRRLIMFTAVLILIAAVSVHGFVLSVAIALGTFFSNRLSLRSGNVQVALIVYSVALVGLASAAMPLSDGTFVSRANPSVAHFFAVAGNTFAQALTGETWTSLALVAASLPLLWRGGGLLVFALATLFLCLVNGVIYSQVWHMGLLFLMWVFALWVSAAAFRSPPRARRFNARTLAYLSVAIATAILCFGTVRAVHYDWGQAYSGSAAAAQFLKASELPGHKIFGIGYSSVAIQPYFNQNVFANLQGGRTAPAFWDWSNRNRSLQDLDQLAALNPDYVVVGYTNLAEKVLWSHQVRASGYETVRHFEGNLFWRTDTLEPASFDIYRRRANP